MSSAPGAKDEFELSGWLLKAAPQTDDEDKKTSFSRKLRNAANSLIRLLQRHGDFKRRFFVLDGNELRYFQDDTLNHQSGYIDLGTVTDIKYAEDPAVPAFAFQLVRSECGAPAVATESPDVRIPLPRADHGRPRLHARTLPRLLGGRGGVV
jgi:hypothetical protein